MGKTITVIGGGDILDYSAVAKLIKNSMIICADSGYNHCEKLGVTPDLLVGDFDSIRSAPDNIPMTALSVDKNYSDSFHAVEEAQKRGATQLILTGMLGGRTDHSLANVALLVRCAKEDYPTVITDGLTTIHPIVAAPNKGLHRVLFDPLERHYFSLLAYSDVCERVSIYGGKYPLHDYPLTNDDPRAVSNEFLDGPLTVELASGILLFITSPIK